MKQLENIKLRFKNNGKVVENYFFMTALQIISSAFGVLIYPYLIRVLGAESYGLYVFAVATASYFVGIVSFGFSFPGVKAIAQNKDNLQIKSAVVSSVFTSKILLGIVSLVIFIGLLLTVPLLKDHKGLFLIVYAQILCEIFFPIWYFQGVQKMKIVTYFQLAFRILSLPFIFILVRSTDDLLQYAFIATLSVVLPAVALYVYLIRRENLTIRLQPISKLKTYFKEATPFFWSSTAGTIKQESVTIIIGAFFGMKDVALYDLANKLIMLPRMLTMSINTALFPKVIEDIKTETIKKIEKYETMIGLAVVLFVVVFGYWIIWLLGGKEMTGAYPLAIVLSFTVLTWLVVGCYINFVFVPQNKYYFVTRNQIVALISFVVICVPALFFSSGIMTVVVALTLSGFSEIAYSKYLIRKNKLL
ncbi:MAG: oligosaccharide flippase family protein [Paludibacter sp.]|nr:oligosaccharide flippase family protein [Paludibacter sp.]